MNFTYKKGVFDEMEKNMEKPSLLGIFTRPSEQFERIRQNPVIWGPLAIITIVYFIASIMMAQAMTAEDLMVPGAVTLEDAEVLIGLSKITMVISSIFAPIIGLLVSTVIYFIIIKIAKKDTTFKQLFSMSTFIMGISTVGVLLNNLLYLMIGGVQGVYLTSLAGIMRSDSLVLASFEVFSIWQLILTAIGLNKVGQLSKGVAWTISIIFFLFGLGMALIGDVFTEILGSL